ncbi:MAG: 50S ribosomal protein L21, partial [Anaerolinea sp.]|nr:50S ribosomal protein L21 [Anaerolinea sp.]
PKSNETPAPTKFESPVPSPDYAPNLPAVPQTPPSAVSEVEKAAPDEAPKAAETPEPDDDLTNIEGIGPKIAATLRAAGVKRFGQLAQMKPEDIEKIVKSAGVRMVGKAETFPAQAQLAAEGKWDELKKLTDHLRGGRAVHDEEK